MKFIVTQDNKRFAGAGNTSWRDIKSTYGARIARVTAEMMPDEQFYFEHEVTVPGRTLPITMDIYIRCVDAELGGDLQDIAEICTPVVEERVIVW